MRIHPYTSFLREIESVEHKLIIGEVSSIQGLIVSISGVERAVSIGDHCVIESHDGQKKDAEIIGFTEKHALAMPFKPLNRVGMGCSVFVSVESQAFYPHPSWLGRVLNALGEPIDGKGPLLKGDRPYFVHAQPPPAHARKRIGCKLDTGVRALNSFTTLCQGQRMGIFSGSGVGKTTLMGMVARYTLADVNVIGLIGERGRELQEFIQKDLGEEGIKKSVIVASTSDESPVMRRQAAYFTLMLAEYFRDLNKQVFCLFDSVTRFAMALREIGLSLGEPPTTRGYTPSVFAELPKLLERAGPGIRTQGDITAFFTVLVEGDDFNEPIADAVRGILDGHIILSRAIAERGRFPAIDVLKSLSRVMPDCNAEAENKIISEARHIMATYADMEDLIRLGAYRKGTTKEVDRAIDLHSFFESYLKQDRNEKTDLQQGYIQLEGILKR